MWFHVKKIVGALVLPPTGPLIIATVGLMLHAHRPRQGRALAWIGLLILFVLSLPMVSSALQVAMCNSPAVNVQEVATAQAIVVFGAGLRWKAAEYDGADTLNWLSLERVRYAAKLARATNLPILVSGGPPYGDRTEGEVMRDVLETEYGVAVRWVESKSRNTHENATFSAELLKAAGVTRVVLICHGIDIRRGQRELGEQGMEVIPAPTSIPRWGFEDARDLLPSMNALSGSYLALYELLGNLLVWLHLGGR